VNIGIPVNAREAVFWIYIIALAIGIILMFLVLQAIPKVVWELWQYIPVDKKIEIAGAIGFLILLPICGILISFWVSEDVDEIRTLQVRIERLEDWQNQLNMERHKEEKRQREEKKKG
jgi:hypothetical protein